MLATLRMSRALKALLTLYPRHSSDTRLPRITESKNGTGGVHRGEFSTAGRSEVKDKGKAWHRDSGLIASRQKNLWVPRRSRSLNDYLIFR